MNRRLADLRTAVASLDQARVVFRDYVLAEKRLAAADALLERQIADRKAAHQQRCATDRAAADALQAALASFITANRSLFETPRTVKTDFGEFGLRTVTDVIVSDEAALFDELLERGYDECYTTVRKPLKPALRDRLAAGEVLAGCALRTGDTVICKPARALIDAARKEALE